MDDLVVLQNALGELMQGHQIDFANLIILEDTNGNEFPAYEFRHRAGWFGLLDSNGNMWTNAAEIVRASGMSKQAVQNLITRALNGQKARLYEVHELFTSNRAGDKRKLALYNEELVAHVLDHAQNASEEIVSFLEERANIIKFFRGYYIRIMKELQTQNADLTHELHAVKSDLNDALLQPYVDDYPEEFGGGFQD